MSAAPVTTPSSYVISSTMPTKPVSETPVSAAPIIPNSNYGMSPVNEKPRGDNSPKEVPDNTTPQNSYTDASHTKFTSNDDTYMADIDSDIDINEPSIDTYVSSIPVSNTDVSKTPDSNAPISTMPVKSTTIDAPVISKADNATPSSSKQPTTDKINVGKSYFKLLGIKACLILVGLILFIVAFPLLISNESAPVNQYRASGVARGMVVPITTDNMKSTNDGKLILIQGTPHVENPLYDDPFGVQVNALKLIRTVEMYQWVEDNDKPKNKAKTKPKAKDQSEAEEPKIHYTYSKKWLSTSEDSQKFHQKEGHENPDMTYQSMDFPTPKVVIGAFKLSDEYVTKIRNWEKYPLTEDNVNALPDQLKPFLRLINGDYYYENDPKDPQVGDVHISFKVIKPSAITVIGRQEGSSVVPYTTDNVTISLLKMGKHTTDEMFDITKNANDPLTWAGRFGYVFMIGISIAMMLYPLKVFADTKPFLTRLYAIGVFPVTIMLTLILGPGTFAIIWLTTRPFVSFLLLTCPCSIAAGIYFYNKRKLRKKIVSALDVPLV